MIGEEEISDLDPLKVYEAQDRARADAAKADADWCKLCRRLLKTQLGRDFVRAAIARHNVMGSVFSERMDALEAARNDGRREVVSDILNSAASGRGQQTDSDT